MEGQKPTVGRIVHYVPGGNDPPHNGAEVLPAIITRVWSDTCVNLRVFNDGLWDSGGQGNDFWVSSAMSGTGMREWTWPPRA